MKQLRKRVAKLWRPVAAGVLAAGLTIGALSYQLQALAPQLSPAEQAMRASSSGLLSIVRDPQHAPYRLLEWAALHLPAQWSIVAARLPSVILAVCAMALMIYLLRRWYGRRTMVMGFAVVLCSAWFLHIGRFAGTDIEYFTAVLALLAVHIGLHDHENSQGMFFVWLVVNMLLLFVPGMVWFVLISVTLQPLTIAHAWQATQVWWQRVLVGAIAVVGVALPAVAILRSGTQWTSWLGLPGELAGWRAAPHNLLDTLAAIGLHGPHNPQLWLGTLPLFDLFLLTALLAGIAFYARHWQAARSQLLGSYLLLGIVLVSLGTVSLSVLVPVCYLIIAAGIAYLLHFWLSAFPLNPVVRGLGISLVAFVIGLSCYYNIAQYFVAWPHNPEVSAVYQH